MGPIFRKVKIVGLPVCLLLFCFIHFGNIESADAYTVNPGNREESRTFFNNYYMTTENPAMNWTGNQASCDAGTTALSFLNAMLIRINYFRAMAGVPAEIMFSDAYSAKAQKAALMMSANSGLSHAPPPTWNCYTADGAEAAGSSNLYLGTNGTQAIAGYMKDPGSGNGAAGHRRWILYPQSRILGTGDVAANGGYYAANALWVFDLVNMWSARPATREAFVAWPPPGYVPYQVVYPRWSFSYANADFSSAVVSMSSAGSNLSIKQETTADGYGENTLVWIPMSLTDGAYWPKPSQDKAYAVTIENVKIEGISHNFSYTVTVFDPATDGSVVLRTPTFLSPANNTMEQSVTVTLMWADTNSDPQESGYRVRIKPAGGNYVEYSVAQNGDNYAPPGLQAGVKYYWSVKAIGNGTTTKDSIYPADRSFTIYAPLVGDVDRNGIVSIADAIIAMQIISGSIPAGPVYREADVDGDGKISMPDLLYILQKVAGLR